MRRSGSWIWLQLIIGWLPMGALFMLLLLTAHPGVTALGALAIATRMMVSAAILGLAVRVLVDRHPWPRDNWLPFVGVQVVASIVYAGAWIVLISLIESVAHRHLVISVGPGVGIFLMFGVWLYLVVAAVLYASQVAQRAAHAEATAARAQLAALRGQLHPHFLFNALHTVVQLIPREPRTAAVAAERLAGLLRSMIDEDRDLVLLSEECRCVEEYLAVERLRFGDRLRVQMDIADDAARVLVPSFVLLTLVENAVRHGAEPNVDATTITVAGRVAGGVLTVTVCDTGAGMSKQSSMPTTGSGLRRLGERIDALYGRRGRIDVRSIPLGGGFRSSVTIPCVLEP